MVTPLVLLLLVGVMQFGRAWGQTQVVTDAARQGARIAALLNNSSAGQDSVCRVVRRALQAGNITVPTCPSASMLSITGWKDGTNTPVSVTVRVPYDFGIFTPVMQLAGSSYTPKDNRAFNGAITLRSTAIMRNE